MSDKHGLVHVWLVGWLAQFGCKVLSLAHYLIGSLVGPFWLVL